MYSWLKKRLEISHSENAALLSMEGLRGVAVFLVFCVHYSTLVKPWLSGHAVELSNVVHGFGHLGVDLFFVLSGYLIYGSIIEKPTFDLIKYAGRRAQRIYPTFLVVFGVYIVLSFIFPSESKLPEGSLEKIIYILQNLLLLPGIFDIKPIIVVAWSLSYEVFYYIAIPCLVFLLNLKQWQVKKRIILWSFISVMGFCFFALWGGPGRLLMFISGILLFELYAKKNISLGRGGTRFLIAALMIFGLRAVFGFSYALSLLAIFILFLLLCLCALNPKSNSYRWLSLEPIRWLGNMSYSYYLIHGLTLKFAFLIFGIVVPSGFSSDYFYYWFWIPLFAMTLVSSFVLFWLVERPFSLKRSVSFNKLTQDRTKVVAN